LKIKDDLKGNINDILDKKKRRNILSS